jgi:hypothetical protein
LNSAQAGGILRLRQNAKRRGQVLRRSWSGKPQHLRSQSRLAFYPGVNVARPSGQLIAINA